MIDESSAKKFCRDDISKIENYDKAINDQTQTWVCHHRLGLTLDGEFAHSKDELKRLGMYLDRPYFELQFLPPSEHRRLHGTNRSDETKRKLSEAQKGRTSPMYGKTHSDETRRKISEAMKGEKNPMYGKPSPMKGKPHSDETRRKISESHKGKPKSEQTKRKMSAAKKGKARKPLSDETKKKLSEASRAYWARRKANA